MRAQFTCKYGDYATVAYQLRTGLCEIILTKGKSIMPINAIDLLKQDHEKVRGLLAQLTDTTSRAEKTRTKLISEIAEELRIHTKIEEQIFYPAFKEAGKDHEEAMFYEASEEHKAVEMQVLPDLEGSDVASEAFTGRAKVLREMIEHHAKEEEKEMFPQARKLFDDKQLEALGEKMMQLKQELSAH